VGSAELNKELSKNRADAVRDYLVNNGASAGRIIAVGYGDSKPLADNETEEGRAKNRRTEFMVR
jgi:outer membrane protein OmpA-like peptidoglycan-associated protein